MQTGEYIHKRYVIQSEKYRSNQSIIYEVYDTVLEKKQIMKVILQSKRIDKKMDDQERDSGRLREVKILSKIRLDGIPGIVDYFICENNTCIIMEEMPGITLSEWMRRNPERCRGMSETIITSLASLVSQLHSLTPPVICADLKPDNILINEKEELQLIDFGAGILYGHEPISIFGTYGYAPLEQENGQEIDLRCDVYAIGRIAMQLWTQSFPAHITKEQEAQMQDEAPQFYRIVKKCCESLPAKRYESAKQLFEELQHKRNTKTIDINKSKFFTVLLMIVYELLLIGSVAVLSIGLEGFFWEGLAANRYLIALGIGLLIPAALLERSIKKSKKKHFILYSESNILLGETHIAELLILTAIMFSTMSAAGYENAMKEGTEKSKMLIDIRDENNANILLKNGCELQMSDDMYVCLPPEKGDIYQIKEDFGRWRTISGYYRIPTDDKSKILRFRRINTYEQDIVTGTLHIRIDMPK